MSALTDQRGAVERARRAREAAVELEAFLRSDDERELKVTVAGRDGDRTAVVPRDAVELFVEIIDALGRGQQPSVVPMAKELSTGEVGSLLGVSRQYVVRLLDDGRLPFRRVGNRRRVQLRDALRYLRDDDRRRVARLAEVAESTIT